MKKLDNDLHLNYLLYREKVKVIPHYILLPKWIVSILYEGIDNILSEDE